MLPPSSFRSSKKDEMALKSDDWESLNSIWGMDEYWTMPILVVAGDMSKWRVKFLTLGERAFFDIHGQVFWHKMTCG